MPFTLQEVVPWGRSFEEYVAMFGLNEAELGKRFLSCSDGPASFNAWLTRRGGEVISADPVYRFSKDEIKSRIEAVYDEVIRQTEKNRDEFVWKHISSVKELGTIRMAAMDEFLSDYEEGLKEGRYVEASLPRLPFKTKAFNIALCSHFLFLYSEHFSLDFHIRSIKELCRVASQVRIFPVLELGAKRSRHLSQVVKALGKEGFVVSIEKVPYEFQKGGNEMLKVL